MVDDHQDHLTVKTAIILRQTDSPYFVPSYLPADPVTGPEVQQCLDCLPPNIVNLGLANVGAKFLLGLDL